MRSWRSLASLVLGFTIGCNSGTEPTPTSKPSFSHTGIPDINGSIFLGSGGENICSRFAFDTPLLVRALSPDLGIGGTALATCPANDFSMPIEQPGQYLVRVSLPIDQPLGLLPPRWLEPVPVDVQAEDVVKDLHVEDGTALRGRATVDGLPVEGVSLTALYANLPGFGANFGASAADVGWDDGLGRSAFILQNDVDYSFTGCDAPPIAGIKSVSGFPTGPVHFPSESDRLDCNFISGDALRFTHRSTRLKLSSLPGDIGGMSVPLLFPEVGYGYSAQFPLPAGQPPKAGPAPVNRQLFRGGLVLGLAPDVALAGTELEGYVICSVSPCRAFGFDGKAKIKDRGTGKEITWTYTDAGSQRPMGLKVVQRSFDGQNGRDYVIYGFRIVNQGMGPVTFTPGVFLDFDVSPEFFSNLAYTELNGRLAVTTNPDETLHFGSVIVGGATVPANYFFDTNWLIPESEVVSALRGMISSPEMPFPTDIRLLQGGDEVTLMPDGSTDFWVAIVAGESRAEVIANAQAALADGNARRSLKDSFRAEGTESLLSRASLGSLRGGTPKKVCKRDCVAAK